jgi:hypothetical protein
MAKRDGTKSPFEHLVLVLGGWEYRYPFPIRKPRGHPRVGANAGLSSCLVRGRLWAGPMLGVRRHERCKAFSPFTMSIEDDLAAC